MTATWLNLPKMRDHPGTSMSLEECASAAIEHQKNSTESCEEWAAKQAALWFSPHEMRDQPGAIPPHVLEALQEAYEAGHSDGYALATAEAEKVVDRVLCSRAAAPQVDDSAVVDRALRAHRG